MDSANISMSSVSSSSSKADKKQRKKRKHDDGQQQQHANGTNTDTALPNTSSAADLQAEADRLAKRARKDGKKNKSKRPASLDHSQDPSSSSSVAAAAAAAPTADSISASAESAYRVVYPILNMPIAPVMWKRPLIAVQELFDTMVMRYVPQLGGILIAHEDHTFLSEAANIKSDSAFATAPVKVKCTVWAPVIGMRLEGKIVYSNTDVVSLLLNGIFNAAIPAAHLPANQYEFIPNHHFSDSTNPSQGSEHEIGVQSPGFWRRRGDKAPLGGTHGKVIFTCYGMTVANQLLFLRGSLLKDPFKPLSALELAMQGVDPGSSAADAAAATGAAVDARALQALFPNVNLDFSSKNGFESGTRRSAVRAGGANGSQNATDARDVAQKRRVHWDDEEEDDAGQPSGGLYSSGAAAGANHSNLDDDDDDDDGGAAFSYEPASSSAAAGPPQAISTTTVLAADPVEEREQSEDEDEDGDVSMADISMASSVATTASDMSITRDDSDGSGDSDDDDDDDDGSGDDAEQDVKPVSPSTKAAKKENGKDPSETKAERQARREAKRERKREREARKAAKEARRAAKAAKKAGEEQKKKKNKEKKPKPKKEKSGEGSSAHKVKKEALDASASGSGTL